MASPLTLPHTCHSATICEVELTLNNGTKAAIIYCYFPQSIETHSLTCGALANLPQPLPHSFIIIGGDLQGGGDSRPLKMHTSLTSLTKDGRGPHTPPTLHANNPVRSPALIISPYGILGASPTNLGPPPWSTQLS
jgi:hypothetical protein